MFIAAPQVMYVCKYVRSSGVGGGVPFLGGTKAGSLIKRALFPGNSVETILERETNQGSVASCQF